MRSAVAVARSHLCVCAAGCRFDAAVAGCDVVYHIASPVVILTAVDPDQVVKPAVEGTLNVYGACAKAATVKKVVTTSSYVAVLACR